MTPLLSEGSLVALLFGALGLALAGGVCFTIIFHKEPNKLIEMKNTQLLHVLTVLCVVAVVFILSIQAILSEAAITGLLGAIVGYVLGSLRLRRNNE